MTYKENKNTNNFKEIQVTDKLKRSILKSEKRFEC